MKRLITVAVVAATMLTGAAHADENPKAVLFAGMMTYEKACSAKLPPVAKDWMNEHMGTFTEKDYYAISEPKGDPPGYGAHITLSFDPNESVDATQIAFVQTVKDYIRCILHKSNSKICRLLLVNPLPPSTVL
jgi:hypothetical protein